jgi:hypothetical protein
MKTMVEIIGMGERAAYRQGREDMLRDVYKWLTELTDWRASHEAQALVYKKAKTEGIDMEDIDDTEGE